jgi:hypothetical protein
VTDLGKLIAKLLPAESETRTTTRLGEKLDEFGVAENKLAQVAGRRGLVEFNPEDSG